MSAFVGRLEEFPEGSLQTRQVAGRQVAVANALGKLYAIKDQCPHAQQPLSSGYLRGADLVCIFHWAVFDLAGKSVLDGPATEPVSAYNVEIRGDEVYVSLQ